MKKIVIPFVTGILSFQAYANQPIENQSTEKIWNHHIQSWVQKNVNAIISDYSPNSKVILNGKIYEGKESISSLFYHLFELFGKAEEHIINPAIISDKIVYITWHTKIDGRNHPVGTDTFIIDSGKIEYQTITSDNYLFRNIR